jgi:hypothetical protein
MASRDLKNNIKPVAAVAPAVLTATNTSAAIDLLGFESAAVSILTGAIAGDGNFTPKLQHSDTTTSGDFVDVPAADLIGEFPSVLEAASSCCVGYKGGKRYVRTVLTLNSGTSIAAGASVILGHPRSAPTA